MFTKVVNPIGGVYMRVSAHLTTIASLAIASVMAVSNEVRAQDLDEVVRNFTLDDVEELLGVIGGQVTNVRLSDRPDVILAEIIYPDGMQADFTALQCEPAAEVQRRECSRFIVSKWFDVGSPERAAELSRQFNANWFVDHADGDVFGIRRMDWISNGVTRAHFGAALSEFRGGIAMAEDLLGQAR